MSTVSADLTWYRHGGAGAHEVLTGFQVQARDDRWLTQYNDDSFQVEDAVRLDAAHPQAGFIRFIGVSTTRSS
jgi:hypothetical protein